MKKQTTKISKSKGANTQYTGTNKTTSSSVQAREDGSNDSGKKIDIDYGHTGGKPRTYISETPILKSLGI